MRKTLIGLLLSALIGAVALTGCQIQPKDSPAGQLGTTTAKVPATQEESSDGSLPASGVLKVGTDIDPGTYGYTIDPDELSGMGYWSTCSDPNCSIGGSLIENGVATGPGYLEIGSGVAYVEVRALVLVKS
ncbi:hypothetical protein [Gordonia insulae]|uniref:Lipoprotein n=1 Tax=Gordonia insulae TaxID=2420509 RepID=A0A3G8JKV8_9ACTN|nr:hypothetical protein [Gordonia insulae]AZG45653.1 hypothetical protein D7316_02253 [Gordonia insulae]